MAYFWFLVLLGLAQSATCAKKTVPTCPSNIYCQGDLLKTVQLARIYDDSKTFVDMKLRSKPEMVLENFAKFKQNHKNPSKKDIQNFVEENFEKPGSEFEEWKPADWIENPKFLQNIRDEKLRAWASKLNEIWKLLGRKIKEDVKTNSDLYSIVFVKNGAIVPGGRFREFYYWDSYWIMVGLLLCEMTTTVKGMLENFSYMVNTYGIIPNGGRIYYMQRSQPPLYIPMVKLYYDHTNDVEFIKNNIGSFEKEYQFWTSKHIRQVTHKGKSYEMAFYGDDSYGPRPESFREDYENAQEFFDSEEEREEFYSHLKAAAESGWDFSSRWFVRDKTNNGTISAIKTKTIMPVDLNAILYWNAALLSEFFELMGNREKADHYQREAQKWLTVVNEVFWDEEVGIWLDYDAENSIKRNYFYQSNIVPLWTGCYKMEDKDKIVKLVLKYLQTNRVLEGGGVPSSLYQTGEQWDYPNAWPPSQYIMIEGLNNTGDPHAMRLAYEMSKVWVMSNYKVFETTGDMYEKYDAHTPGGHGGGGEYTVQLGFGWSNGVVLELLNKYGHVLSLDPEEDYVNEMEQPLQTENNNTALKISTVLIALLVSLTAGFIGVTIYRKRSVPVATKTGKNRPSSWHYTELKNISSRTSTRTSR